ncbi:MAG: hypothetical protein JNL53_07975 [Cyclobacteriaceae bacterium]|nr:hypothetical protein [Cyclobacteriaceae bacterium]
MKGRFLTVRIIMWTAFVIVLNNGFSQGAMPQQLRAQNTLDQLAAKNNLSGSDILYGMPIPPGQTIGDYYLNKNWNKTTILLYQSEKLLEGYSVKYNLQDDQLEVITNQGIKVLEVSKIKNIVWMDSLTSFTQYFVNGAEYKLGGVPTTNLLEVLVDGDMPLLKKTSLFVKEPTYNVAFDVGSRDKTIYQKSTLYYAQDGTLYKVKGKKDVMEIAGIDKEGVDKFVKSNKLNLNTDSDLIRVFEYLNSQPNN